MLIGFAFVRVFSVHNVSSVDIMMTLPVSKFQVLLDAGV